MKIIEVNSCEKCPYCDGEWFRDGNCVEYWCIEYGLSFLDASIIQQECGLKGE